MMCPMTPIVRMGWSGSATSTESRINQTRDISHQGMGKGELVWFCNSSCFKMANKGNLDHHHHLSPIMVKFLRSPIVRLWSYFHFFVWFWIWFNTTFTCCGVGSNFISCRQHVTRAWWLKHVVQMRINYQIKSLRVCLRKVWENKERRMVACFCLLDQRIPWLMVMAPQGWRSDSYLELQLREHSKAQEFRQYEAGFSRSLQNWGLVYVLMTHVSVSGSPDRSSAHVMCRWLPKCCLSGVWLLCM